MAGFMIQNVLEGTVKQYHWHDVQRLLDAGHTLLDVRTPMEFAGGHIEGAKNIPVDELRQRVGELDKAKPLYIYCQSGQRSYIAARMLAQQGFDVQHMAGGYRMYVSATMGHSLIFRCNSCK